MIINKLCSRRYGVEGKRVLHATLIQPSSTCSPKPRAVVLRYKDKLPTMTRLVLASILWLLCTSAFSQFVSYDLWYGSSALTELDIADLTGDGIPEIIVASQNEVMYFEMPTGQIQIWQPVTISSDFEPDVATCEIVDFDLDGDIDVFYVDNQNIHFLENDGFGSFTDNAPIPALGSGGTTRKFVFPDVDDDGDLDLFITMNTHTVLYENQGGWENMVEIVLNDDCFGCRSTHTCDWNMDGQVDLIEAYGGAGLGITIYENGNDWMSSNTLDVDGNLFRVECTALEGTNSQVVGFCGMNVSGFYYMDEDEVFTFEAGGAWVVGGQFVDWDLDGNLEWTHCHYFGEPHVMSVEFNEIGHPMDPQPIATGPDGINDYEFVDRDGDGDLDIFFCTLTAPQSTLGYMENLSFTNVDDSYSSPVDFWYYNNILKIHSETTDIDGQLLIFDSQGRSIHSKNIKLDSSTSEDLSFLSSGVYIASFISESIRSSTRFVVR